MENNTNKNISSILDQAQLNRLGILEGQKRWGAMFARAGFYGLDGKKVSWGDLSKEDILVLTKLLPEPLFILSQGESYYNHITHMEFDGGPNGRKLVSVVNETAEKNPGLAYVLDGVGAVIVPKKGNFGIYPGLYLMGSEILDADHPRVDHDGILKYVVLPLKYKWKFLGRVVPADVRAGLPKKYQEKLDGRHALSQIFQILK